MSINIIVSLKYFFTDDTLKLTNLHYIWVPVFYASGLKMLIHAPKWVFGVILSPEWGMITMRHKKADRCAEIRHNYKL